MKPYWSDDTVTLYGPGDCRDILPHLAEESVAAVVTDPPYEYGFMGATWDATGAAFDVRTWRECLRVLKPGGYLLAFGGTRTWHRLTCAIEDAGFEIRDSIDWIYGSGFPKSLDVSKAIDRAAGSERDIIGISPHSANRAAVTGGGETICRDGGDLQPETQRLLTAPATDAARRWDGWGTALKPAHEPIVVARKPFPGTVAANVLAYGTGALNIDATRVGTGEDTSRKPAVVRDTAAPFGRGIAMGGRGHQSGRWPTNVVLTHQPSVDDDGTIIGDACEHGCAPGCPVAELDRQSGVTTSWMAKTNYTVEPSNEIYGTYTAQPVGPQNEYGDSGGASRFFPVFRYERKASSGERPRGEDGTAHVTVKPLALMRWLVRLVTPRGGVCLDPFLGSGTTAEACVIEGFRCIGVELDPAHLPLIKARLSKPIQPTLGEPA